jgi:hypothetical protein
VVKKAHLLLEDVGVIFETVLVGDVLLLDPLNVVKVFLTVGKDLSGVVKVHADHIVAQNIPDTIF